MFFIRSLDVANLLAAGGPGEWLVGSRWPLHEVLRRLSDEVRACPDSALPYAALSMRPDADVGTAVAGVNAAVTGLVGDGALSLEGEGILARWVVNDEWLIEPRRDLMRMDPSDAALIYRAGRRWAALTATALKNWRIASLSWPSTVRSPTPHLRQVVVAGR